MRVAKVAEDVAYKMHLFLGFLIFVIGVLVLNSAIALIVSICLILYGIFADRTIQKTSDLSHLFIPSREKTYQKIGKLGNQETEIIKVIHDQSVKTIVPDPKPNWTIALLQEMDWKRFEDLCCEYFSIIGFKSVQTGLGADGGVDIYLYKDESDKVFAAAQCKAWTNPVGVEQIRAFFGVMVHKNLSTGYFVSTSTFYQSAKEFAVDKNIHLIDGKKLIKMIEELTEEKQNELYKLSTKDDYKTPSCSKCGIKMVLRNSKSGQFWGCRNYPRCKSRLKIKKPNSRAKNLSNY